MRNKPPIAIIDNGLLYLQTITHFIAGPEGNRYLIFAKNIDVFG